MGVVLIVSNTGDIHCDFLVDACSRRGAECFRLNTDQFRKSGLLDWRLDSGEGLLKVGGRQCRLSEVDLLIYRRPIPVHQLRTDIDPWIRRLLDSEWSAIEFALSRAVDCRVMNGLAGSALAQVADSRPIERRLTGAYQSVPPPVAASLAALCGALSIEFASSDFVEDATGQLWFLDLNPEGQWAYLEHELGVRISDEIVALAVR